MADSSLAFSFLGVEIKGTLKTIASVNIQFLGPGICWKLEIVQVYQRTTFSSK
jgi:hypothetical protein